MAKEKLKADKRLAAQAAAMQHKDTAIVVEEVRLQDGTVQNMLVLDLAPGQKMVGLSQFGSNLYLGFNDGRTEVVSAETGKPLRVFLGHVIAGDSTTGRICLVNRPDELSIVDGNGAELLHQRLGSAIRYAQLTQKTGAVLALTADQRIHLETLHTPQ